MEKGTASSFARKLGIKLTGKTTGSGWLEAHCPFAEWTHEKSTDLTPSFGISIEPTKRSHFKCFACHLKGTVPLLAYMLARYRKDQKLVAIGREAEEAELLGDVDVGEWKEDVEDKEAVLPDFPSERNAFREYPFAYDSKEAVTYLRGRGYGYRTARDFNLRWDGYQQRVLFPVYDTRWRFRGFTSRAICDGTDATGRPYPKVRDYFGLPKRELLLGGNRITIRNSDIRFGNHVWTPPPCKRVVIVEGPFDLARQRLFRVPGVVSLLGSELTPEKERTLEGWGLPVVHFVDNDEGGTSYLYGPLDENKTERIIERSVLYRLSRVLPQFTVTYPDRLIDGRPINDPDELTYAETWEMLRNAELYTD